MTTCPECKYECQTDTETCPDCGSALKPAKGKKKYYHSSLNSYDYESQSLTFSFKTIVKLVVGIFVLVFIAGIIAGILSDSEDESSTEATARIEIEKEFEFPPAPEVNIKPEELFDYNKLKPWDGNSARNTSDEDLIRDLFMIIGSANLKEDIDLFQTGYSSDFPGWDDKKNKTLAMWKKYDFIKLGQYIAELDIEGETAYAFLIWKITLQENGGEPRVIESTNKATLQKEADGWKIVKLD